MRLSRKQLTGLTTHRFGGGRQTDRAGFSEDNLARKEMLFDDDFTLG